VVDDTGDCYKVDLDGNVTGDIGRLPIPLHLKEGTIDGYLLIGKAQLETYVIYVNIEGTTVLPVEGEVPITVEITSTFDPAFIALDFPLYVDKSWTIPSTTVSVEYTITLLGIPETKHQYRKIPSRTLTCREKEPIYVEAGMYDAFKITDESGLIRIYYVKEVANIVKVYATDARGYISLTMELTSTSYLPIFGSPNKPATPWGETRGEKGETYQYCTTTTDPENDQIYYLFSWGDNTVSGWLGPYNSGETVCAYHYWVEDGIYKVRVKARDVNGAESIWSDPLTVIIGGDSIPPYVEITKPEENSVYLNNVKIGSVPLATIIIGYLQIEVEARDAESGIDRVEFYVDGRIVKTDTEEPYTCVFTESPGLHVIRVTAYDGAGNSASDSITVWKLF
jgi:hypothetical protein